jgi:PAP2 superfamily protein
VRRPQRSAKISHARLAVLDTLAVAEKGATMTKLLAALITATILAGAPCAFADVVTDANARAAEHTSKMAGTPPAVRAMAIVQVSVYEAVNAITGRHPAFRATLSAPAGASVDAAVAAATRTALLKLVPAANHPAIEADYQAALTPIADGKAKTDGIAVGEQAALQILAACESDGYMAANTYRPHTAPGVYVPTMFPAVPHWGKRKPWIMTSPDQFRPGPPPSLTSETWKRDFNEIKAIGSRDSTQRTAEQTAIARFWEATMPVVYWPVVRSVATAPGRDVSDNARLFAVAAVAMDDGLIAVFDAKYTYNFWRPVTAIRNAEADLRDPAWMPFVDTPMHPEYPCAHCIVSGALGGVLETELGNTPSPTLSSASPTAGGAVRTWVRVGDFMQEVAVARIYDGVHYRNSTEIGSAMGKAIGQLATQKFPKR